MFRSCMAGLAVAFLFVSTAPLQGQTAENDWTERPDRFAPAGVFGDRVLAPGELEIAASYLHRGSETLFQGRSEFPFQLALANWQMAPLSLSTHRLDVEVAMGLLDWLSFAARVPLVRNEAEFVTNSTFGMVDNIDVGDGEVHAFAAIHDRWPVRAQVSFGAGIPTGSTDAIGRLPNQPGSDQVLPYQLQTGSGAVSLLPGAALTIENGYGTFGIRGGGQIWIDDNDRDWSPGNAFNLQGYGQYRFSDWIAGSVRVNMDRWNGISGEDASLDPSASPMHWRFATGGTRVDIPVGVNVLFRDGSLAGTLLQAEVIVPAHSDVNGPQLAGGWGAALSWRLRF